MKSHLHKILFVAVVLLLEASCLWAADLKELKGATYVPNRNNDGDSFMVKAGEKEYCVRLYFVDCLERTADSKQDARRLKQQTRHFGLKDGSYAVIFAEEAKEFTRRALAEPFTMHTALASAPGRTASGRIYAFITTSTGKDLAQLLVANGYARALGKARKTPDGISHSEMKEYLRDLEVAAGMKRAGIWAKSDPDRLVELRQKQRLDDKELEEFKKVVDTARAAARKREDAAKEPLNINKASQAELEDLPGIGATLAKRIIAGRPYKSVDELLKVRRLGPGRLKKIRPHVCVP